MSERVPVLVLLDGMNSGARASAAFWRVASQTSFHDACIVFVSFP